MFSLWAKVVVPVVVAFILCGLGYAYFRYGSDVNWRGVSTGLVLAGIAGGGLYGLVAFRISSKMMGFVRLAEGIFQGFGWQDVKNIDLPAITKKSKQPGEPGALGVLYFRY